MSNDNNNATNNPAADVPIHGPQAGFESVDAEVRNIPGITVENLVPPEVGTFLAGESISVLQVNGKDNRDASKGEVGALTFEAAKQEEETTEGFLGKLLDGLSEGERSKLDIIVIASSAELATLNGVGSDHKRAVDTGKHAISGFKQALKDRGLDEGAIVNTRGLHGGDIFETEALLDVPFLHDISEEGEKYREAMVEKYGATGFGIWAAYEKDKGDDRKLREQTGMPGPVETADAVADFMHVSQGFAEAYQEANPDRRLIIWAIGHYDSLTHYIKRDMLGEDIRDTLMPMDKLSGVVIHNHNSGS